MWYPLDDVYTQRSLVSSRVMRKLQKKVGIVRCKIRNVGDWELLIPQNITPQSKLPPCHLLIRKFPKKSEDCFKALLKTIPTAGTSHLRFPF